MKVFMDWIYSSYNDDRIGLPRKYETYENLCSLVASSNSGLRTVSPGVAFIPRTNRWRANIYPTQARGLKKIIYCGVHRTVEAAQLARKAKMAELNLQEGEVRLDDHIYQDSA